MKDELYIKTTLQIPVSTKKMIDEIKSRNLHNASYAALIRFACESILQKQPRYDRIDELLKRLEGTSENFVLSEKNIKGLLLDVIFQLKVLESSVKKFEN